MSSVADCSNALFGASAARFIGWDSSCVECESVFGCIVDCSKFSIQCKNDVSMQYWRYKAAHISTG